MRKRAESNLREAPHRSRRWRILAFLLLVPFLSLGCDKDRFHRVNKRAIVSWDGSKFNVGWDVSTPTGVATSDGDESGIIVVENVLRIAVDQEYVGGEAKPEGRFTWFILGPNPKGPPSLRDESYEVIHFPNEDAWRDAWKSLGLKVNLAKPKV